MKYRIKFTKGEEIKFIGHLDVMRLFQRAINRAKLPVAYSKGFNPHQLLAFANPLSLGMTSGGEYGDFEMKKEIDPTELVEKLNQEMPDGIQVLEAVALGEHANKAMASVEAAAYKVTLDKRITPEMLQRQIVPFLEQKEIFMMKKTKHQQKETDIRPDIYHMKDCSQNRQAILCMLLAAGSIRSVKAELVIQSLYQFLEVEFDRFQIRYERSDLFRRHNGKFVPLSYGVNEAKKRSDENE